MANDLTNIMPQILAAGLRTLRETAVMPRLVNFDWSTQAAQKGETIDVPIPTAVGTRDVAPSNVPPVPVDFTPGVIQIPLDKWRQTDPIFLTDKDRTEIDAGRHFLPMQMAEGIRSLGNFVNETLLAEFVKVFEFTGIAGTTPFGSSPNVTDATNPRKILGRNLAPFNDRRGVIDFDAEANMLSLAQFHEAEKVLSSRVVIEGEIGRKYGIDWIAESAIPTHIAGDDGGSATVDGVHAIGVTIVAIDDMTFTTGTYFLGDIISFAGHSQTYVVTALATADGGGNANITIQPPLVAALADTEAVTQEADHVVNLIFQRDAFALAMRPLSSDTADGARIMSLTDPVTGLSLRLEVSRQHKQTAWEFDVLFGVQTVRPEFAVRLAG